VSASVHRLTAVADPPNTVRWFIVHVANGKRAEDSPGTGFASQEKAEEFHKAVFKGDSRLEVREVPIP